jgi:hypothetical protein
LDIKSNRIKYGKICLAGAGTQTAGLAFGGNSTAYTAATEEWTGAGPVTVTITGS